MPVLNIKYIVFSFSFIHSPIGLTTGCLLSTVWLNIRFWKQLPLISTHYLVI